MAEPAKPNVPGKDGKGDDDLSLSEVRKALEEHIARCRRCRIVLDTTRRTLKIVLDAEPFEVPLAVSARLYTRLEQVLSEDGGVSWVILVSSVVFG